MNHHRRLLSLLVITSTLACSNGNNPADGGTDSSTDTGNNNKDASSNDAANDSGSCSAIGSGTVTGTLLGNTLAAKDAISSLGGGTPYVVVTDFSGACALGNNLKANSSGLLFDFLTSSSFTVGTVNVGAALDVQYATYDATCNSPTGESSTSGSVTITSVDSCKVVGTFDVTLNNDHVTGSFTAPNCVPSVASLDGGTACQ